MRSPRAQSGIPSHLARQAPRFRVSARERGRRGRLADKPDGTTGRRRRGNVLVAFAFLTAVLLGLGALVIDLGVVYLTRGQMQAAADTAALEGLRHRDDVAEIDRRLAAQQLAGLALADPAQGSERSGSRHRQTLQLNLANDANGDLVSGNVDPETGEFHPSLESPASAFKVRLRRGGRQFATINPSASSGSQIPSLFNPIQPGYSIETQTVAAARPAKTVGPAIAAGLYPGVERDIAGLAPFAITAQFWKTLSRNEVQVNPDGRLLIGQQQVGQLTDLSSLDAPLSSQGRTMQIKPVAGWPRPPFVVRINRELLRVSRVLGGEWRVERGHDGTSPAEHSTGAIVILHRSLSIGQPISKAIGHRPELQSYYGNRAASIVPIVEEYSETDHIVAFGVVGWSWDSINSTLLVNRRPSRIASQNAMTTLAQGLPPSMQSPENVSWLFDQHKKVAGTLLAPAIVR